MLMGIGKIVSRATIVTLVIGWTFSGCSVPPDPEVSFSFDAGLSAAGLNELDELFRDFSPELLTPTDCDTSNISQQVDSILVGMTLDQKIAQLLVVPLTPGRGGLASSEAHEMVELGVGGFQVPRLMHPEDVAIQSGILQHETQIPLFFAADYERGAGRFNNSWTELPSNMGLGATGNVVNASAAGRLTGIESRSIGINLLFAPVLDVNTNPDNPIINIRSFGDSPEVAATMGAAFIREVERYGVIATAKHFPGHGSSSTDSHSEVPVVDLPMDVLETQDLFPFAELIKSGNVDTQPGAIMIGHVAASALDASGLPASLSKTVIRDYLRDDIGFNGLVVTDDLRMGAAARAYPIELRLELALNAGVDILLTPGDATRAIDVVRSHVRSGRIGVDVIDAAVRNILATKIGICAGKGFRHHAALIRENAPGKAVAGELARRAVTLVRSDSIRFPEGYRIEMLQVSNFSGAQSIENGMRLFSRLEEKYSSGRPLQVAVVYARLQEGRGTAGLQEGQMELIERHLDGSTESLVVILGNPYLGLHFTDGTPVLVGYDQSESTAQALIDVIEGRARATGRLPFEYRGAED